ncbi:MAG: hypothetical protein EYC62_00330 [Alphaproteobacteria bacterium]|nr:MAG: hypothetical protein EYC62_00330 [Alphaproteobacteria bacterium]
MANIPSKNHPWRRGPLNPPPKVTPMPAGIGLSTQRKSEFQAVRREADRQVSAQRAAATARIRVSGRTE